MITNLIHQLDGESSESANSATFDLKKAKNLVRGWPVTIQLYDSGQIGFICRPFMNGERQNRSFSTTKLGTLEEAAKAAVTFCKSVEHVEKTERVSAFPIPLSIRPKLEYHIHEIQQAGLDPIEALKIGFEELKSRQETSSTTFSQAAAAVIEFKRTQGKGDQYVKDLTTQYGAFAKEFGHSRLADITASEIEDFLTDRDIGPVTWNNWRRILNVLWNFAMLPRNKWVMVNVADQVAVKTVSDQEVTAFTVPQAKQVLQIADAQFPRLMPFLVIGMFCGLRISEIERAGWEDIDWDTKTIHAGKYKRKNSMSNRHVNIAPVALAWLERYRQASGPFIETGYAGRRADLQKLRELTFDFDANIFRHTFGSYHNEAFKNSPLTAQEMGHTSAEMIAKHYRKPIPQLVALGFWNLTPDAVLSPVGS